MRYGNKAFRVWMERLEEVAYRSLVHQRRWH